MYLKDSGPDLYPPKSQPRGRAGIHVGYAQHKALVILDLERYIQDQLRIFVVTRDIRRPTEPYSFPVRELLAQLAPGPLWHFSLPQSTGTEESPEDEGPSLQDVWAAYH